MKNTFLVVFVFLAKLVSAQDTASTVIIHKDPRIDLLIKKQAEVNLASKKASGYTTRGFRVMVINTTNREEAIAAKTKIYTNYPELKAYLIYKAPYYKLKAGNFKSRDEAEKYQKYLSALFPNGVFIISDTIEVAPEKEGTE